MFFDFNDEGAGSGVVIRDDGYIVTNYHVVQNADEIAVSLPSGDTYTAKVVGQDLITDLAVIKVDNEDPLPTADLVSSDAVNVGDWVVAVGNSLALKGGPTVTLGIISAKGRHHRHAARRAVRHDPGPTPRSTTATAAALW